MNDRRLMIAATILAFVVTVGSIALAYFSKPAVSVRNNGAPTEHRAAP